MKIIEYQEEQHLPILLHYSKERLGVEISPKALSQNGVMAFEDDGKFIGCCFLYQRDCKVCHLDSLLINPEYQFGDYFPAFLEMLDVLEVKAKQLGYKVTMAISLKHISKELQKNAGWELYGEDFDVIIKEIR